MATHQPAIPHTRASRVIARRRRVIGLAAGLLAAFALPAMVLAHPLGNFTINHYAGVRVEPDRILLDVVIDQAEIPAFQARLAFDTDGDGELSDAETEAGRTAACDGVAESLDLQAGGRPLVLTLVEAGLTFPPGAGGLSTMRSVCGFSAALAAPLQAGTAISFTDRSFAERVGWREIAVEGSGVSLASTSGEPLRAATVSDRLSAYPKELLSQALAETQVSITASPGGATLVPFDIPDADPVAVAGQPDSVVGGQVSDTAAVPGGVAAGDLPAIFRTADLTPIVLLISVLTAGVLGAGHALTPGHGKTLMAAYLVGTRGTPVHAAGLGLSVALSHTLGILVLAGLVVGAQGLLPPDVVVRTAPVVAAISIVAIGGWMLFGEARRRLARPGPRHDHDQDHDPTPGHDHGHASAHDHGHGHDAHHEHDAPVGYQAAPTDEGDGEHSHGGRPHSHLPPAGASISWRSLFVLGLAGGLIPSASALLILLGSIAAGRPAFGFVLVVAFGLGMALVMGGIGLALVIARGRLDRVDTGSRLGRTAAYLPLAASVVVLGFGLYLTAQAVSGSAAL